MKFSISEYARLDEASKHLVEQWVADHVGDYHDVKDVGIAGNVAWFQHMLRNAEGNRYLDENRKVASEVIRVSLKRPFPTGLKRVQVPV